MNLVRQILAKREYQFERRMIIGKMSCKNKCKYSKQQSENILIFSKCHYYINENLCEPCGI